MSQATTSGVERAEIASSLRIIDILAYLRGHLLMAAGIPVACALAGVVVLLMSKPVYRSEAVLLPISDDGMSGQLASLGGQLGGLASLAGVNIPGSESAVAGLATLSSKHVVARFIEQEKLLPVLFEQDWDPESGTWTTDDPPTLEDGVDYFDRKVRTVVDEEDTGLVTLSVDWRDPKLASEWAMRLIALADQDIRRRSIEESQASLAFLERQLKETGVVELQQAIYALMESETKRIMLASARPEYAFRIIDPPRTPDADAPIWPNPPLILMAALLVGLGVVFVIAVLRAPDQRRLLE